MEKKIAFFDFDGTITTKDTMLELIKFEKGLLQFYLGFILTSPFLIAYKLKIISNQAAKEKVLRYFFGGSTLEEFNRKCDLFAETRLPSLLRPKAILEIKKLKDTGAEIIVVSASPENWIRRWSEETGVALLATKLETRGSEQGSAIKITGRILGVNCYGKEKVRRICQAYSLAEYNEIYTYGDTPGDRPMLQLGTVAFYKPFR